MLISGLLAACAVMIIIWVDAVFRWLDPPFVMRALLDVGAHAATGLLVALALRPLGSRWFFLGIFLGAVLIDVDHLPAHFGRMLLGNGEMRPYTHSLAVAVVTFGVGLLAKGEMRSAFLGASIGIVAHLLRDTATGGAPLLWPASAGIIELPYAAYMVFLAVVAYSGIWNARSRVTSDHEIEDS